MRAALFTGLAMALIALAACGGADPDETVSPAAAPAESTVAATTEPTATAAAEPTGSDTPEPTAIVTAEPTVTETPEPTPPEAAEERQMGQLDGYVFVVTEGSEATFTVEEQLASLTLPNDAVMRTNSLSGTVHFDGRSFQVEVDLRTLSSDQSRRDQYVRLRMFPQDPIATFTVEDILPLPDGFTTGEEVTSSVAGELVIRSNTTPLTFELEARDDGHTVFVLGRTQFTWDQLSLDPPAARSVVWVADEVRVEILLALDPVLESELAEEE